MELRETFDKDNNGEINYGEFVHMMKTMKTIPKTSIELQKKMESAFAKLDKDGDGFISIHELKAMLIKMDGRTTGKRRPQLTESDLHAILAPMDINGDGKLDYREYLIMVGRTHAEIEELLAMRTADRLEAGGKAKAGK